MDHIRYRPDTGAMAYASVVETDELAIKNDTPAPPLTQTTEADENAADDEKSVHELPDSNVSVPSRDEDIQMVDDSDSTDRPIHPVAVVDDPPQPTTSKSDNSTVIQDENDVVLAEDSENDAASLSSLAFFLPGSTLVAAKSFPRLPEDSGTSSSFLSAELPVASDDASTANVSDFSVTSLAATVSSCWVVACIASSPVSVSVDNTVTTPASVGFANPCHSGDQGISGLCSRSAS